LLLRAVLKLEETVKQFLMDAIQTTLEFPPSTSNYQVQLLFVMNVSAIARDDASLV
jgi:hypothetical protein